MSHLKINDLAGAAELDSRAMAAVSGGCYVGVKLPSCYPVHVPAMPCLPAMPAPSYPSSSTTTHNLSVSQANNQQQHNPVGNGSAVFGGGIYAYNNQQGFNSIG